MRPAGIDDVARKAAVVRARERLRALMLEIRVPNAAGLAFQSDLLALNAAVETASPRSGQERQDSPAG